MQNDTENLESKKVKKNEKWTTENLLKAQADARNTENFSDLESYGDFGSYRRVLLGDDFKSSMLSYHNQLNPAAKVDFCHGFLKCRAEEVLSVLDLGCGMGYTAKALASFYKNADVTAVDISIDAIEYGKKNFSGIEFRCEAVEPKNPKIGQFDVIFAFEFYPFTRTNDLEIHIQWLKYLLSQLTPGGHLIIHLLWKRPRSVFSTICRLEKEFPEFRFATHTVPREQVHRVLKIRFLSVFFDYLVRLILRKAPNKGIVISRAK